MQPSAILSIGNALVDVLARTDDPFLAQHGLVRGAMALVDGERADALYASMPPALEVSGGSAANTAAGIAGLGVQSQYIGKVSDDQLGRVFKHDIRAAGVAYETSPADGQSATGRCLIVITPDAQRTMSTYLGASVELGPADIDEAAVKAAAITYMEGYLWDPPAAKQAYLKAAAVAHGADRKVALTLSDSFCVERHRESFLSLIEGHVDILLANEEEILSLYKTASLTEAVERVRGQCWIAAITRSEKGALIVARDDTVEIAAEPVANVVDTTGAGDLFAAGFLAGVVQGLPLARCGRMGAIAAAEVITHIGARPQTNLARLVAEAG